MAEVVSNQPIERRKGFLPPHLVRREFLSRDMVARLLDFALANESQFKPARIGSGKTGAVDPQVRTSWSVRNFEPVRSELRSILRPLAPELVAELRVSPFKLSKIELELVAHGDGAFYSEHIDTTRDLEDGAQPSRRLISGVYYFNAMPKGFEGGALRLHEFAGAGETRGFIDVEPLHNSLVLFPSWMPHEVMPVRVPSGRFADSRFAINCWFRARMP